MKKKRIIALLAIASILFLIRLYIDNEILEINSFEISSEKIPTQFNGFKILHLSDLHDKSYGSNNSKLLEKIDKISPDIIVLTGDMVSANDKDYNIFFNFIDNISSKYETFYIYGNHEESLKYSKKEVINEYLSKSGVKLLSNDNVTLYKDDAKVNIYGIMPDINYYRKQKEYKVTTDFVRETLNDINLNEYNILLSHSPKYFEVYADYGFDLVLSGHIHGGLIRLPIIGGVFSPDNELFPKYDSGLFKINSSNLIVSRGLSRGTTGFRLFNKPEMVVITLNHNEKSVD